MHQGEPSSKFISPQVGGSVVGHFLHHLWNALFVHRGAVLHPDWSPGSISCHSCIKHERTYCLLAWSSHLFSFCSQKTIMHQHDIHGKHIVGKLKGYNLHMCGLE